MQAPQQPDARAPGEAIFIFARRAHLTQCEVAVASHAPSEVGAELYCLCAHQAHHLGRQKSAGNS